jgi:hypothetical protein
VQLDRALLDARQQARFELQSRRGVQLSACVRDTFPALFDASGDDCAVSDAAIHRVVSTCTAAMAACGVVSVDAQARLAGVWRRLADWAAAQTASVKAATTAVARLASNHGRDDDDSEMVSYRWCLRSCTRTVRVGPCLCSCVDPRV